MYTVAEHLKLCQPETLHPAWRSSSDAGQAVPGSRW